MDPAEIRRQVLEAVERGDIPRGGPSELAAYDLIEDVPAGYWERWTARAAERIRQQTAKRADTMTGTVAASAIGNGAVENHVRGRGVLRATGLRPTGWLGQPLLRPAL